MSLYEGETRWRQAFRSFFEAVDMLSWSPSRQLDLMERRRFDADELALNFGERALSTMDSIRDRFSDMGGPGSPRWDPSAVEESQDWQEIRTMACDLKEEIRGMEDNFPWWE